MNQKENCTSAGGSTPYDMNSYMNLIMKRSIG
jgi:hypothetical protein